ncbi:cytochrome c oxidase subunit 4 isoform 1, mitochondrial-like [Hylaeus anthracinus]|uniref:cytochrome c oxidase subunit 4 isoform 1, mitochondrial-like n=1 Tax=Hylaeus anthracinus TaxID=313031 RepID=UPI0023B89B4A|nr:cytochrome c oxidase subunit 4 isoform 1, mitochondrial-like [Hylaeus anthracinus]
MASTLIRSCLRQNIPMHIRNMSAIEFPDKIGNRDVVGFGYNGTESYMDRTDYPMPAIRFKANTPDVMALREKEKGDWKKLSIEEKKQLYRASFCQTIVEMQAPTGIWKGCIGLTLMGVAFSIWIFMFLKTYAYPPLPITFDEEHRLAQMERMILLDVNPITGISAKK